MYEHWRPDSGLPRGESIETPAEPGSLERATGLLAIGSFLLFLGWAWSAAVGGLPYFYLACWFQFAAIGFHAAAWYVLGLYAVRHAMVRPAVFVAYVASLVGFGVSLSTLVGVTPLAYYAVLLFPVLPWVWAPVVLAHCALFAFAAADLQNPRARRWSRVGILVLGAVAILGLLAQFRVVEVGTWMFSLAGATFVGYLLLLPAWTQGARPPAVRVRYLSRGFAA